MIPPIIHQIRSAGAGAGDPARRDRLARTWSALNVGFEYRTWDAAQGREFVAAHHPGFLTIFDGYPAPAQRSLALRYLLLAHFGGVYADGDLECLKSIAPLLARREVLLVLEPPEHADRVRPTLQPRISTAFLASRPGHPFWTRVIEGLKSATGSAAHLEAAGSQLLARCYDQDTDRPSIALLAHDLLLPVQAGEDGARASPELQDWLGLTRRSFAVRHRDRAGNFQASVTTPARAPTRIQVHRQAVASGPAPHVSCILLARGAERPARWAIDCFRRQSYPHRELVVIAGEERGELERHIRTLQDPAIRVLEPLPAGAPPAARLGAALAAARGELICMWGEDDLCASGRIAAQVTSLLGSGAAASFLERICLWSPARQEVALSARPPLGTTVLARREVLPSLGPLLLAEGGEAFDHLAHAHAVAVVDEPCLLIRPLWRAEPGPLSQRHALSFQADPGEYDRALTLLDRHAPVLEYLAWLEALDPKTFRAGPDSPARVPASPVDEVRSPSGDAGRLVLPSPVVAGPGAGGSLRFLLAWELGANLGHMVPLAQIAQPLLEAGHEVHLALRDLSDSRAGLGHLAAHPRLHLWQSPYWHMPLGWPGDPCCYAELLYLAGYLDAQRLAGLVDGWRALLHAVDPALLLAEHAPTALLASRHHPCPRAVVGSGFFVPVREAPIPSFRDWQPIPASRVEQAELRVLATCNAILRARGVPELSTLSDLFDVDEQFLITVPELDYYPQRARDPLQPYYGVLQPARHGRPATWPDGSGPAVFVYLRAEAPGIEGVLHALRAGPWRVLAYVPGLNPAKAAELSSPRMFILADPVDMAEVCATSDAVVCHSGSGTVATVLSAARPMVLIPLHVEQFLTARRVRELGAGVVLLEPALEQVAAALNRVLTDASYRGAAQAFARRYARPGNDRVAETIAARCVQLATRARPSVLRRDP